MQVLRVTIAGLRHRAGRSALIFIIALLSATAVVAGPAYSRAAEQSLLAEGLAAAEPHLRGVGVTVRQSRTLSGAEPALTATALAQEVTRLMGGPAYTKVVGGSRAAVDLPFEDTVGTVVYRDGVCGHLRIVAGRCATGAGEVTAAASSTKLAPLKLGATIPATVRTAGIAPQKLTVVGLYEPKDPEEQYWHGRPFFFEGYVPIADGSVLALRPWFAAESTLALFPAVETEVTADMELRPDFVNLDNAPGLVAAHQRGKVALDERLNDIPAQGSVVSGLNTIVEDADRNRDLVAVSVPIALAQLVLLSWFMLYLVVAHTTDELGPEIGLAKLRGFRAGDTATTGLAESLVLVLAAVPVGFLAGLGVTELVARTLLADGVHVEVRQPVVAVCLLALVGGVGAALVAARRTIARPVSELLRRVPPRQHRRAATVAEGIVVTLALAALVQLFTERGSGQRSPLVMAVPALLAIVVGLAATKLLPAAARRWSGSARVRGRTATMLALAQLARRPASTRAVIIGAVAVSLLVFGAQAWDTAGHNRQLRAGWELGADRVLTVEQISPSELRTAVGKADPTGRYAMAATRTTAGSGDDARQIVAVDTTRLAAVAAWQSEVTSVPAAEVAAKLRPNVRPEALFRGSELVVDVTVESATVGANFRLIAQVQGADRDQHAITLNGFLTPGRHTLRSPTSHCAQACRVVGFEARTTSTEPATKIAYVLRDVRSGDGRPVLADLKDAKAWRTPDEARFDSVSEISATPDGLRVSYLVGQHSDGTVLHADTPFPLPAVVTHELRPEPWNEPTSAGDRTLATYGAYASRERYQPVAGVAVVPGGGDHALLVDLTYADLLERGENSSAGVPVPQVWLAPDAPESVVERLTAGGLQITSDDTVAERLAFYDREGPTLALGLYLAAALVAALLAVGAVAVTAYVGARPRRVELAALRFAGLSDRALRRSLLVEYAAVVGVLLVAGVTAGALSAWWALPEVPLFTEPPAAAVLRYQVMPDSAALLLGVVLMAMAVTVGMIIRGLLRAGSDAEQRAEAAA